MKFKIVMLFIVLMLASASVTMARPLEPTFPNLPLEQPPPGLNLVAPTGIVTDTIGNPRFEWTVFSGAVTYGLYVAPKDNLSAVVFYHQALGSASICNTTTCGLILTDVNPLSWLANGTYSVFIKPDNAGWGGPYDFTIQATPPAAPTLEAPAFFDPLKPTLLWNLDADAGRAAFFLVYLAPTDYLFVPALSLWVSRLHACGAWDGTICGINVPTNLANNTYYSFYLQSWGAGGFSTGGVIPGLSGWVYQEFVTGNPPPRLATNLQAQVSGNVPTFTWTAATHATVYELWVGTVVNGTANQAYYNTHLPGSLGCEGGGQCSITLTSTVFQVGQYQWFVRATGPGGVSTYGPTQGWAVPNPPTFTIN